MPIFIGESLVTRTVAPGDPWAFVAPYEPGVQVRQDKESRQQWYQHTDTKWSFYSTFEGANPNQRISSEDNPPKYLHGFAADYDVKIPESRIEEVIKCMELKPSWVEKSLGGNVRLIWLLEKPLLMEDFKFSVAILRDAAKWLRLDLLPGLDEPAFVDPGRRFCNGAEWKHTGHGPIPMAKAQAFYVTSAQEYRFTPANAVDVPLDLVERALKERFPNFDWPTEFNYETQGPSFWIEGSTSPMSAIVKKDGMITFSAHADKLFYSWMDILGAEFMKGFTGKAISNATNEIYWDTQNFWRKKQDIYVCLGMSELQNFFKVQCRLSAKPDKTGQSQVDVALDHIYNSNFIIGAGPFIFQPSGRMEFQGRPVLNTYVNRVMKPALEPAVWGPNGSFPFLSLFFENVFNPPAQLPHFLAWWKHYYKSAYSGRPEPGQNLFLMGGAGVGKTFTNRRLVGASVGGFVDASRHLLGESAFNSEIYEKPLWCVDDETVGESMAAQNKFHAILKKSAANQEFLFSKKYEVPVTVVWMGRIICTTNLDFISSRMLGPMDNTSMDKTSIFRYTDEKKIVFPNRYELSKIVDAELPYFLRWLLDYDPPEQVIRNPDRYGYMAYHEPTLLDQAHQGSKHASFKEILIETLCDYFQDNKNATEWRGTISSLTRILTSNLTSEAALRHMRLDNIPRYLEAIHKEGLVKCSTETGDFKTRVWVFPRFEIKH